MSRSANQEAKTMGDQKSTPTENTASEKGQDPFDPSRLRLSQDFAATVGVKKVLITVPVREPNKQEFVRVHPDQAYRLETAVLGFLERPASLQMSQVSTARKRSHTEPRRSRRKSLIPPILRVSVSPCEAQETGIMEITHRGSEAKPR
jgi:hypothetical protein